MPQRTPRELRHLASRFREMSAQGADESLKEALIELADEFEREADREEQAERDADPPSG